MRWDGGGDVGGERGRKKQREEDRGIVIIHCVAPANEIKQDRSCILSYFVGLVIEDHTEGN